MHVLPRRTGGCGSPFLLWLSAVWLDIAWVWDRDLVAPVVNRAYCCLGRNPARANWVPYCPGLWIRSPTVLGRAWEISLPSRPLPSLPFHSPLARIFSCICLSIYPCWRFQVVVRFGAYSQIYGRNKENPVNSQWRLSLHWEVPSQFTVFLLFRAFL